MSLAGGGSREGPSHGRGQAESEENIWRTAEAVVLIAEAVVWITEAVVCKTAVDPAIRSEPGKPGGAKSSRKERSGG